MLIIGCDFHTRYQQIAMAWTKPPGSLIERRLDHESGEAHAFYRSLQNSRTGARGHRSHRPDSLVRALAHGTRPRTVDRRLRKNSRQRSAQTEDR